MKKHTIFLMLIIAVACLIGLAACGNSNDNSIKFKTLQVTDTTVYGEVSNNTSQFSFIDEISVTGSVTYEVCRDLACTETIPSKTVELNAGNNVFYLLVKKNNDVKLFTVTIRRRPLYLVTTEIDSDVTRRYVEEKAQISEPQQPNVNGYTFANWEINGTTATFPYTVTGNTTVKAKLIANQYSVSLDVNGGEPLASSELTVTYNDYYTLETPKREGYSFDGWYDDDTKVNNNDIWNYSQDKSLKAKWRLGIYNVILSSNYINAGSVNTLTEQAEFQSQVTITAIDNEYLGYTWQGWYDGETLLTTDLTYTFSMPSHTIRFVATWKVDEELENFNFTSDKTTCIINSVKSKDIVELSLPNYITSIAEYAFKDCVDLTSIELPNSISSIGYGAFNGCINIITAIIPTGLYNIPKKQFQTVIINGGDTIKEYEFMSGNLKSIELPNSIITIERGAFMSCKNLMSISIPNSVTNIGERAFSWCTSLTSVTILGNLKRLEPAMFENCSSLENIYIEEGISSIAYSTFENCKNLTKIVIPKSVTSIDDSAFDGCASLKSIYFKAHHSNVSSMINSIIQSNRNSPFVSAYKYYYSSSKPWVNDGYSYWYYDSNGDIAIWT
ncbi:MAG: leucine-rich repeat protein [Clostridia bacterium]|nr:leucine-rich repeat protein [Clostridia bacterium]